METSGFVRGMYSISVWVTRFVATNALWILFNLPIAYLTFNMLYAKTSDQLLINVITIAILAPFIFFPATTAMFGVVRQWVIGEPHIPLIRSFYKYYKENYVRSLLGGLIIVPLFIILIVDYIYFTKTSSPLIFLFLFIGMFVFVFSIHFFSNTVHLKLKFYVALKNSMLLSIGRPVHTIGITAVSALIIYISLKIFTILILLGMGALITYFSFYLYNKSLKDS